MKTRTGILLLKLLYPPRCVLCDRLLSMEESGCCPDCRKKLPWVRGAVCLCCGKPLRNERAEYCPDCQGRRHFFDQGAAAFVYAGELRTSVYRMKARNRRDYAEFYGQAMAAQLRPHLPVWRPEALVPVPMHPSKQKKRGYNQAELLAREISVQTGIPCRTDWIICRRKTTDQKTLGRQARRQNLKGCFALTERYRAWPAKRLLLIDDIYTTGSTLEEVSAVFRRGGAKQIYFAVLGIVNR